MHTHTHTHTHTHAHTHHPVTIKYRPFVLAVWPPLSGAWPVRVSAGERTVLQSTVVVTLRLNSLTIDSSKTWSFIVSPSAAAVVLVLSCWSMLMTRTVWGECYWLEFMFSFVSLRWNSPKSIAPGKSSQILHNTRQNLFLLCILK